MSKLFKSSENKNFIRNLDAFFIEEECEHHGNKLRYFGLPSEGLYDIIRWRDSISSICAVERGSKSKPFVKQNLLISKAMRLGIHNDLVLLRGDINEIIINGKDEVGTELKFPFELVNLDYGGTILYPDRLRIDAMEELIKKQKPLDFVLLLTCNIREHDSLELIETQKRIKKEIIQYRSDLNDYIDQHFKWINDNASLYRQIIHVYYLLKNVGENNKYKVNCLPAINYKGNKHSEMLHYIIQFRYTSDASTRVISDQSTLDLLNMDSKIAVRQKLSDLVSPPKIPY